MHVLLGRSLDNTISLVHENGNTFSMLVRYYAGCVTWFMDSMSKQSEPNVTGSLNDELAMTMSELK